ncbi:FkbM family methyltransferase [Pseudooctadecabacter sp.]|uniref:FkbM family methyltransferase n=1 Tax=Pseudooctadecabacter sp. TaxID=1966338 RepID=UPI0035C7E03A
MTTNEMPEWADNLNKMMVRLNRRIEHQNFLIAYGNLGPDRIVDISHRGDPFRLYVPFGDRDLIQRHLISDRDFYESGYLNALREMGVVPHDKVIIDAGANIGNHTVFFAHYFKPSKLYSFEPQRMVFDTLQRNIELNSNGRDITAVNALLGAEKGTGSLAFYKQGNLGAASFALDDKGETPMVALDDAVTKADRKNVGFMKIDVEGFQIEVLRGAHDILTQSKPALWVEVFRNEREECDAFLAPYGYTATELSRSNVVYQVS